MGLEATMAEEESPRMKPSIYERQGLEGDNTILEIEGAYHPRATEEIRKSLTDIMQRLMKGFKGDDGKFVQGILDKDGRVADPRKAADLFMQLLAQYHFQDTYEAIKHDTQAINRELEQVYGINFESKRQQFDNAQYNEDEEFYQEHRDPLIQQVDTYRKDRASRSLQNIIQDEERSEQLKAHLKTRFTGKALKKKTLDRLNPQQVLGLVQTIAAAPNYGEAVKKDPTTGLDIPEELIGRQPRIAVAFEAGKQYRQTYLDVSKDVDDAHRIKPRKPRAGTEHPDQDYKAA